MSVLLAFVVSGSVSRFPVVASLVRRPQAVLLDTISTQSQLVYEVAARVVTKVEVSSIVVVLVD